MAKKSEKGKRSSMVQSFYFGGEIYDVLDTLTNLDFPFPLGEPEKKDSRAKWFERALVWYLATALRREISSEQVDSCVSISDVCQLWLGYVKAVHKDEGYQFTSGKKEIRQVVKADGSSLIGKTKWGGD